MNSLFIITPNGLTREFKPYTNKLKYCTLTVPINQDTIFYKRLVDIAISKNISINTLTSFPHTMITKTDPVDKIKLINFIKSPNFIKLKTEIENIIKIKNKYGDTLLIKACNNENLQEMKFYMCHGGNINDVNDYGCTLFHIAVLMNNINILKWLFTFIEEKNNVNQNLLNIRDKLGDTPLHLATHTHCELYMDTRYGKNKSHIENINIIKFLLVNTRYVNVLNSSGLSPLYIATMNCDIELIDLFIKNGANVNLYNHYNMNILHYAAYFGNEEIIKYLFTYKLNNNINIHNYPDFNNTTSLHLAIKTYKDIDTIELLIKDNISNVNVISNIYGTPLYLACNSNYPIKSHNFDFEKYRYEVIKLLIKYNANVNTQFNNITPLDLIICRANSENNEDKSIIKLDNNMCEKILLESGAKTNEQLISNINDNIIDKIKLLV